MIIFLKGFIFEFFNHKRFKNRIEKHNLQYVKGTGKYTKGFSE